MIHDPSVLLVFLVSRGPVTVLCCAEVQRLWRLRDRGDEDGI